MSQAVIDSVARTPIGRAYKGSFNDMEAPSLSAFAVEAAIARAGLQMIG
jgi:acetyl-CoA C-acetyltransferase